MGDRDDEREEVTTELEHQVSAFRKALERARPRVCAPGLRGFPGGACSDASTLFARYLTEMGVPRRELVLVSGTRTSPRWCSHAWLEVRGRIVDLTLDQFDDAPRSMLPATDAWHATWTVEHRREVDVEIGDCPEPTRTELLDAYAAVAEEIRSHTDRARSIG